MLKNLSNLGTVLNKAEQQSIQGGFAWTFFIEEVRHCLYCPVISWEDNPTADDFMDSGCYEVVC